MFERTQEKLEKLMTKNNIKNRSKYIRQLIEKEAKSEGIK